VTEDAEETGLWNGNGRTTPPEAPNHGEATLAGRCGERLYFGGFVPGGGASEMSAEELLTAFRRDAPYLFCDVAVFGFASYSTAVYKLETDDRIVMYTDGVVEASNAAGDFFGHGALCDLLTRTR
jgi:hypothetical protein